MSNRQKKTKEDMADKLLGTVNTLIPGFTSFLKKVEKSQKFGGRLKLIREEINRRFGKR